MTDIYHTHIRPYNNPLSPKRTLWELQLIHKSWRKEKHLTSRGNYFRIIFLPKKRYWKINPISNYYRTKAELKVWGKFHR